MPELKDPQDPHGRVRPVYVTYFGKHYEDLRFPLERDDKPGLRRGQAGALHAIAAHFTFRTEPAVVTMPTGSGKTVVLALSPFILRASRVLVITPSRLVRAQITDEFATLGRVISTGALNRSTTLPRVMEIRKKS
jgi:superfamily II DNA or RNA helicase